MLLFFEYLIRQYIYICTQYFPTNSSVFLYIRPHSTSCTVDITMKAESADCKLLDKPDDSKTPRRFFTNTEEPLA